jgi:hypothetical protein
MLQEISNFSMLPNSKAPEKSRAFFYALQAAKFLLKKSY